MNKNLKNFFELVDKIEKEERRKIKKEIKNLTFEELEQLKEQAKTILNSYSPAEEGHDRQTAFINYTKYTVDFEELEKATTKKGV